MHAESREDIGLHNRHNHRTILTPQFGKLGLDDEDGKQDEDDDGIDDDTGMVDPRQVSPWRMVFGSLVQGNTVSESDDCGIHVIGCSSEGSRRTRLEGNKVFKCRTAGLRLHGCVWGLATLPLTK